MKRLKGKAAKGFSKVTPKWAHPTARVAVYCYFISIILQGCAMAFPFWTVEDLTKKDDNGELKQYTLTLFGYVAHVVRNPSDPKPLYPQEEFGGDSKYYGGSYNTKTGQIEDNMGLIVAIFLFLSLITTIVGFVFSIKTAKDPAKSHAIIGKGISAVALVGFILGLLGLALFTPGEAGDKASLGAGFTFDMGGLLAMLMGCISLFDASGDANLMPAVNMLRLRGGRKRSDVNPV